MKKKSKITKKYIEKFTTVVWSIHKMQYFEQKGKTAHIHYKYAITKNGEISKRAYKTLGEALKVLGI